MATQGSSQSVALLGCHATPIKLTGTGGQADRQTDEQAHVLSQADALTKMCICVSCNFGASVRRSSGRRSGGRLLAMT